jgi:hypothetical protein
MDYLDNPERRSAGWLSGDTSANNYGFRPASTVWAPVYAGVRTKAFDQPGLAQVAANAD